MVNKADSIVARVNTSVTQAEINRSSFTSKLEEEDIDPTDKSIGQENNEAEG